jgi:mannose-1-phosphate guanylyltransferase
MKALLLAAGLGTRLRPITDTTPKCLVRIHGKPLLDYWFDLLFSAGIERALVNTHWLAEEVEKHVAGSRWRDRVDTVYEPELLGTGGTVVANRAYFAGKDFLLAHADNLTEFDVPAFIEAHRKRPRGCVMTMLTFQTDDPRSCGILTLDKQGVVQEFHEKVENPPGKLANAAVYIVGSEIVDLAVSLNKPFVDLSTEVISQFLGRIFAVETPGYHRDIGNLKALERAEAEFHPL